MNNRRTWMVAAAVVIGLIAATVTFVYTRGIKDRAYDGATLVKVHTVKKPVPKGLSGSQAISQNYVAVSDIPQEYRPGSAVENIGDIKDKVALYDLAPGTVVVTGMFMDAASAQVTAAERVDTGQVAVSFSFDQVRAVGGHLTPGDMVDIFVSSKDAADEKKTGVRLLYQNARVWAIGSKMAMQAGDTQKSSSQSGASAPAGDGGIITFSVPVDAAQRLILLSNNPATSIYLGLVPPDNTLIDVPGPVDSNNVFNFSNRTPYPAEEAAKQ